MPSKQNVDILIIGAGVAGLAAWRELYFAGRQVAALEARDRIVSWSQPKRQRLQSSSPNHTWRASTQLVLS
jgi:cation diffusion facilitator CzcD-associated flavoprotein CzcO